MATKADVIPERDPIAGLNSILDLYSGKVTVDKTDPFSVVTNKSDTATTNLDKTETSTTRSNLTQEQLNNQIDMAMAPLNQAAHGSGLSTYGDTTLALGRGQIAADILAKNAGTTTTNVTKGNNTVTNTGTQVTINPGTTRTAATPGPLSSNRIGSTLMGLGLSSVAAIGAPLLKKFSDKAGITTAGKSVSDTIGDYLFPTAASNNGVVANNYFKAADETDAAGVLAPDVSVPVSAAAGAVDPQEAFRALELSSPVADAATSAVSDVGTSVAGDIGTSVASDVGTEVASQAVASASGDAFDTLKDLFFAQGGEVKKSRSYADGGSVNYIDRNVSPSNLVAQSSVNPILRANGEVGAITPTPTPASAPIASPTSVQSSTPTPTTIQSILPTSGTSSKAKSNNTPDLADFANANSGGGESTGVSANGAVGTGFGGITGNDVAAFAGNALLGAMTGGASTVANGVLGLLGLGSIGQAGVNAFGGVGVNNAASDAQMAAAADATFGDVFGAENASSAGAVNGADAQSDAASAGTNAGAGVDGGATGGVGGGYGGTSGSGDAGTGDMGGGGDAGGGDGEATGGAISGPGTGTSDSIAAHLSDGETVITAQTTSKVKELLGDDFFFNLEKQFNAPAARSQIAKGRV